MLKLIMIIAVSLAAITPLGNWKSDPSTAKVSFKIKGPFGNVDGDFTGFKSDIQFDEKNPVIGSITASIDANTVNTGIGLRNRDLRKKELWLDTEKYPQITFKSKKIEKTNTGYKAIGELSLKGATKTAEIPFTFIGSAETALFKGQFTINREDYKIGNPGGSVGNVITITLEIPVKK